MSKAPTPPEIPKKKRVRDYDRFATAIIEEATKARFEVKILDTIVYGEDGFPFLMLLSKSKKARHNAVITSGMHGDEFYAVDCLIRALEELDDEKFNFWIFPVTNPWGYARHSRVNGAKQAVNWVDETRRKTREQELILKNLPAKVDIAIDVHGDVDRAEVYCYEKRLPKSPSIAKKALKEVASFFDVLPFNTIYKEPVEEGVVTSELGEATMEEFLFATKGAAYSLTPEIPGKVRGINRASGGAKLIVAILKHFLEVTE